jgi:formylglycine-generating enzyme required for sulfatase activity
MGYIIAILICMGDNCDLLRPEPESTYPTYEACSQATAAKAGDLGKFAAAHREQGRESEILCLRPDIQVVELDEEHEALVPTDVHETPTGDSRVIGTVARGNKVRVTGAIAGTKWLRITLPNGKSGYIFGERTRKMSFDEINAATVSVASSAVPPAAPARAPPPSVTSPPPSTPPPVPPQAAIRPTTPSPALPPPKGRQEFRDCEQCPVMIALPLGSFDMGSSADPTERPIHRVNISAFALGKYEVTQGEWSACLGAGGCGYKREVVNERLPMMNLSWDDAVQYANWLRSTTGKPYRLPSEAEWEYAARAGTQTPYPWGLLVGIDKANCSGCGGKNYDPQFPAVAGSYAANDWGFFDMFGSVAEWVEDCWHKDYTGAPTNGAAWPAPRCLTHVLRGGSWKNPPKDITVSSRNYYDASVRYLANGVRIALGTAARAEIDESPRTEPRRQITQVETRPRTVELLAALPSPGRALSSYDCDRSETDGFGGSTTPCHP